MIDYVVMFLGWIVAFLIGVYAYTQKLLTVREILDLLDEVKDNEHVKNHLLHWKEQKKTPKFIKEVIEKMYGGD